MTAALEARYRRALRWYPRRWRADNEDAILGVLLDGATERDRPRAAEVLDLAANGLRARLEPLDRMLPSTVRDRASDLALGLGFGVAFVLLLMQEWAPWATSVEPWIPAPAGVGPFAGWGGLLYSVWVTAFLLIVSGFSRTGRWLLVASIPFSILLVSFASTTEWQRPPALALAAMGSLALITALGRPLARRTSWLPLALAALVTLASVIFSFVSNVEVTTRVTAVEAWRGLIFGNGAGEWYLWALITLAAIAAIARRWSWFGAAALLSVPWLGICLVQLIDSGHSLLLVGVILLVFAVFVAMCAWHARGYRLVIQRVH